MAYRCPIDGEKFAACKKEAMLLKESLDLLLGTFDKIKEWADVDKWLRKVLRLFEEATTPYIPNKSVLFQRLAQCLSPNLPTGIHNTVLKIYDRILQNGRKGPENLLNDLVYFSQGLFPFYRVCSNQFKPAVIGLFEQFFLPLQQDLGPVLPAFFEALTPPLAENNEAVQKLTFRFFDQLCALFPPPFVFCTLWMVIFRSPQCRYGCLKYLSFVLNRDAAADEEEEGPLRLSGSLDEEAPAELGSELSLEEAEGSAVSLLPSLPVADEPLPSRGELPQPFTSMAQAVVSQTDADLSGLELQPSQTSLAELPLLPLADNAANVPASPAAARPLSAEKENKEGEGCSEAKQTKPAAPKAAAAAELAEPSASQGSKTFLPMVDEEVGPVEVGDEYKLFLAQTRRRREEWAAQVKASCATPLFPNKTLSLNAIRRCLEDPAVLLKKKVLDFLLLHAPIDGELAFEERTALARAVILELEKPDMLVKKRALAYLFGAEEEEGEVLPPPEPHLRVTLAAFEQLLAAQGERLACVFKILQTVFMEKEAAIELFVARLALQLVNALSVLRSQGEEGAQVVRRFIDSTFTYLTALIGHYAAQPATALAFEGLEVLGLAFADGADAEESLPGRQLLFEGFLKLASVTDPASPAAASLFARLEQLLARWGDLRFDSLRGFGLAFTARFDRLLEDGQQAIDMVAFEKSLAFSAFVFERIGQQAQVVAWLNRLESFLEQRAHSPSFTKVAIRGVIGFLSATTESLLLDRVLRLAVQRSWQLLDDVESHAAAFQLILELHAAHPTHTYAAVKAGLRAEDVRARQTYLQRLVAFWRLSAGAELRGASRCLEDFVVFELLAHLENAHPLLRQIAKSWLIDSAELYARVLDPLLRNLLAQCSLFGTFSRRLIHAKEYDTSLVLELFSLLRNLIANNPRQFARFALSAPLSDHLVAECFIHAGEEPPAQRYHQFVLDGLLRYVQGRALPFMAKQFVQDNLLVNTAACELLELHVKTMLGEEPGYLREELVGLMLRCYHTFIQDGSAVMQIHVIGLLKFALFQSGFGERSAQHAELLERIFVEKRLLATVLTSVTATQNNYTLLKIVDFLQTAIAAFAEALPEPRLRAVVGEIFDRYAAAATSDAGSDSSAILINAVCRLVGKFCALDAAVPREQSARRGLAGLFSRGDRPVAGPAGGSRRLEGFFVEKMRLVVAVLVQGWRVNSHPRPLYDIYNIGAGGFQVECGPPGDRRNDEHADYARRLFGKYRREFFDALIGLFADSFCPAAPELAPNPVAERLLDLLLFLDVSLKELSELIQNCATLRQARARRRAKETAVSWRRSQVEMACVALFNLLIKFRPQPFIEEIIQRKQTLRELWFTVIDFAKFFAETAHVMQLCWVINTYYAASARFPLPEIIDEYRIKSSLHIHENDVLERIVGFVCDDPAQSLAFERGPDAAFAFCLPLPSELTAICLRERELYCPKLFAQFEEEFYLRYFSKITALKFLKAVTNALFKNTYGANKLHRVARRMQHILNKMFAYVESLLHRKNELNTLLYEEVMGYVFCFVEESRAFLMDDLGPLVRGFFDSDLFFECSPRGLGLWAQIINWHVEHSKGAVLEGYLANVNFSSLFKSKREETRVRFKSFHRLCFILYAGEGARLLNKRRLKFLLEAIRDALRGAELISSILIVLFFCLRIVVFKTPSESSGEIFSIVWPTVFALLVQILKGQLLPDEPNVKLAALKLLEAFCADNIDQVYLHYFALGFDHCCVEFLPAAADQPANFTSAFPFVPLLTQLVAPRLCVAQPFVQNELREPNFGAETRIVFRCTSVESEQELSPLVLDFMQSLVQRNCFEHASNPRDLEQLIIDDFIALNKFATVG